MALAAAWPLAPLQAEPAARFERGSYSERLDAAERRIRWPDEADAVLDPLKAEAGTDPARRRAWLFTRGRVAAEQGDLEGVSRIAQALRALPADALGEPAAHVIEARLAVRRMRFDDGASHAQQALAALSSACGLPRDPAQPLAAEAPLLSLPPGCDYRAAYHALLALERRASGRRDLMRAADHARAAAQVAWRAGDDRRRGRAMALLAEVLGRNGDAAQAEEALGQASRIVHGLDDEALAAYLKRIEARLAGQAGRADERRRLNLEALQKAGEAGDVRLEVDLLVSLSDLDALARRPAQALVWVERGLPLARRLRDLEAEGALLNNGGVARIALGRRQEAEADMDRVLALWHEAGHGRIEAQTLQEFGEAHAAAGNADTALALYHRERALSEHLDREDRDQALQALQARYDSEEQQRRIELLQRDNALKAAELGNRALRDRLWALAAIAFVLAGFIASLLHWRLRGAQRRLAESQVQLREQSERDPLTGLANRQRVQAAMARSAGTAAYAGGLLLIDLDHFKGVNDKHGHVAGDTVLRECARRLAQATREDDLLVRWGGEEFLLITPSESPAQLDAFARRLLQVIGDRPVALEAVHATPDGTAAVTVTASIGYARFPLPRQKLPLSWEQAVHLADCALFRAKALGRNRAVGLLAVDAEHASALRAIEEDFAAAEADGRATLAVQLGPQA